MLPWVMSHPGVTVDDHRVLSDTRAEVELNISLGAPVGVFQDAFSIYSDYQTLYADFEITPVQNRSITIDPNEGYQSELVTIDVTGYKTDFLNAAYGLDMK